MAGYKCIFCGKVSGVIRDSATKEEKPALSDKGCSKSSDGYHKWIKK